MIFLFTDYGLEGPYIGQVKTVLHQLAPSEKVINLMADAPRNNPKASAYLLASLVSHISEGSILFCVVDPGVGTDKDKPVILKIDEKWFVGSDNGLFDLVVRNAKNIDARQIIWQPEHLSNSFHGRDLYAPVCAMLANGQDIPCQNFEWNDKHQWPDDLYEIIYIDHFGNCMTGINASNFDNDAVLSVSGYNISHANTFAEMPVEKIFWYKNSNGLLEIAMNKGSAAESLQLKIENKIQLLS